MRCEGGLARGFLVAILVCCGCGPSEPALYDASGAVMFNGQPVPDGEVTFVSEDGRASAPGRIKDGSYSLKATAGKKIVRIRAMKIKPGGARDAFGAPAPEDYLPARYNTQSILHADVAPAGPNQFDFALTSN